MAKKIKKTTKTAKPSRLAHEVKHTDWKFVITVLVLGIIGLGVFQVYKNLAAKYPEIYTGCLAVNGSCSGAGGGHHVGNHLNGGFGSYTFGKTAEEINANERFLDKQNADPKFGR